MVCEGDSNKKKKINILIAPKLYYDTMIFGKNNDLNFSECLREAEKLYGVATLTNVKKRKINEYLIKQVKYKRKDYLRIKQIAKDNKIGMTTYLTSCLEKMLYDVDERCVNYEKPA